MPIPAAAVVGLDAPPAAELAPLQRGEAIGVVADKDGEPDSYLAGCVRDKLAGKLPDTRVLSSAETRDALFPWLEPGRVPVDDAAVRRLLDRPPVAARLAQLRLRYVLAIDGEQQSKGGGLEDIMGGAGGGTSTAKVSARALDLANGCCRADGLAHASGIVGDAHLAFVGVIVVSPVQTAACTRLSAALASTLAPRP